jgi:hypothetical protein
LNDLQEGLKVKIDQLQTISASVSKTESHNDGVSASSFNLTAVNKKTYNFDDE